MGHTRPASTSQETHTRNVLSLSNACSARRTRRPPATCTTSPATCCAGAAPRPPTWPRRPSPTRWHTSPSRRRMEAAAHEQRAGAREPRDKAPQPRGAGVPVREIARAPGRGRDARARRAVVRVALLRIRQDLGAVRREAEEGARRGRQARRRPRRSGQEDDHRELGACGEGGCGVAWPIGSQVREKAGTPHRLDSPFARAAFGGASPERLTPTFSALPKYAKLSGKKLMNALRRRKPATGDAIRDSLMLSLSTLAATWIDADLKAVELEGLVEAIVRENAPAVLEIDGCGALSAAELGLAAGDNPGRMRSEASFAMLCGASPVEASSGKTVRHRLNRGGNRRANRALRSIVISRMRDGARTSEYTAKRVSEGKSKREARRCLKNATLRGRLTEP